MKQLDQKIGGMRVVENPPKERLVRVSQLVRSIEEFFVEQDVDVNLGLSVCACVIGKFVGNHVLPNRRQECLDTMADLMRRSAEQTAKGAK